MIVTGFVRVAKLDNGKPKFTMAAKPTFEPLRDSKGDALATVQFGVQFEIPDEALMVPLAPAVPVTVTDYQIHTQEVPL